MIKDAKFLIYKFVILPHFFVVFGQVENWNGVYSGLDNVFHKVRDAASRMKPCTLG
jgi:hypothetical protein